MRALAFGLVALLLAGCAGEAPSTTGGGAATTTRTLLVPPPPPDVHGAKWEERACAPPPPQPTPTPDLLALEPFGNLTRYTWDGTGFVRAANAVAPVQKIAVMGRTVVTAELDASGWHLVARGADLAPTSRIAVPRVTALAANATHLLVATPWNLTIHDASLAEVGRADLGPAPAQAKSIHAIALRGGDAYLLDDAEGTFAVFRVDVRDPALPRIAVRQHVGGSVPPSLQWLDPATGMWYVEESRLSVGTSSRRVVAIHVANGTVAGSVPLSAESHASSAGQGVQQPSRSGEYIVASTFTLPSYAITVTDEGLALGLLGLEDGVLWRACAKTVGSHVGLQAFGGLLVTHGRMEVAIREAAPGFPVRAEGSLPRPPLSLVPFPAQDAPLP